MPDPTPTIALALALGRSGLPSWDSSLPWLAEVSELSALTKCPLAITPYLHHVS